MYYLQKAFFIDQSACYKFNVAKSHCGTGASCRPGNFKYSV